MKRLFAVDPSLTCTGWACFDVGSEQVLAVGKLRSLSPKLALASRLLDFQGKVAQVFEEFHFGQGDVLLCESPTTMMDPRATILVEQVRGIFETLARARAMHVPGRVNPRTVQFEVLGLSGKQMERKIVKQLAADTAHRLYGPQLKRLGLELIKNKLSVHQDILDALLIGTLGLARIQSSLQSGISLEELLEQRPHWNTQKSYTQIEVS